MFFPNENLKGLSRNYTNRYGGLDERDYTDGGSFSDMKNMSSDNYPYISPRGKRRTLTEIKNAVALCIPEYNSEEISEFTGVAGNYFYYKGTKIDGTKLLDGEKELADFNGKICIFPDKVYYRYLPDPDSGEVDDFITDMEKELKLDNVTFYSLKNEDDGIYKAYIQKSDAGFDEVFKTGDSIVISNASNEQNNVFVADGYNSCVQDGRIVSAVADEVTSSKLNLILSDKNGSRAEFKNTTDKNTVSVKLAVPNLNHICVHNNRLWGTSEDGRFIYASALGDCCNFYSYRGLASDSWYGEVGTGGEFTAVVSYRTGIAAFKKNYIHQIYGDKPNNYSIPKQIGGGCIDGRSVAEVDGALIFLGNDGFYIYSGGQPSKISYSLKTRFIGCIAVACGHKYYAYTKDNKGNDALLVYDAENSVWHKQDNPKVSAMATDKNYVYAASDNSFICLNSDNGDEEFDWSVTSGRFTASMFNQKGLEGINIRINAKENVSLEVYISYNENEFTKVETLCGKGLISRRIPVRYKNCDCYRIKICGKGFAVIEAIEKVFYASGQNYHKSKEGAYVI